MCAPFDVLVAAGRRGAHRCPSPVGRARQRDRKETAGDGWLGGVGAGAVRLLQSFAHPTVDPYPSRGVVSCRDLRKALALAGVVVTADEVRARVWVGAIADEGRARVWVGATADEGRGRGACSGPLSRVRHA